MLPRRLLPSLIAIAAVAAACSTAEPSPTTTPPPVITTLPPLPSTTTTTTTLPPIFSISGTVATASGDPLPQATVTVGDATTTTDESGTFALDGIYASPIEITRPGWMATRVDWKDDVTSLDVTLEPRTVRALRADKYIAGDPAKFAELLDLAAATTVNALVFDTKDESGFVLYDSQVAQAIELDAVHPMYDPAVRIAAAHARGLYTITRIVSFEDRVWSSARKDQKLAGNWIDITNRDAWEYPLGLAVEACRIGFDEIQFDYVRFPAGKTAAVAKRQRPLTEKQRIAAVGAFLTEARDRLHPLGCALSADIFAIVLSTSNDQGIGQRPEELSTIVDAISPMIYPSHYSDGWLGFPEPNDFPGPVVADALDGGLPRLIGTAIMRPWLQAFYYDGSQVLAGITAAEDRGVGWMLWNAGGIYARSWLPDATS